MTAALLNHLWQSTVFTAAVALLALAVRHNRARLRYVHRFTASLKFLVPFAALAAVGGAVAWQHPPAPIRSLAATPIVRDFNAPFATVGPATTSTVTTAAGYEMWIAPLFLVIWACGCVAIAMARTAQWRTLRAAVRSSRRWLLTVAPPAGVVIRTAPTVREPGVIGVRRPVILLPTDIETYLSDRQLATVLAHEVCHVRRRDNLTAAVHMLVEVLFWFHPLVWWIGSRLVAEREQACDEHVVAETAEPIVYAEGIVNVCRRYVQSPVMAAGVGGADVKARIEAILANRIGLRLTPAKRLVLALVAALSLIVPLAAGALESAAFAAGQLRDGSGLVGPAIDPESRFDVVSIKPSESSAQLRVSMTPGRLDLVAAPVRMVMGLVLPLRRVVGWPDGLDSDRYTISAKMPDGAPQAAMPVAIRNLLKDRFKLATHLETRELPVYNLVLLRSDGRLGPTLKESSAECQATVKQYVASVRSGAPAPAPPTAVARCLSSLPGVGTLGLHGQSISSFATLLPQFVDRQVIDRTGLSGIYDLTLKWTPDAGVPSVLGLPPEPPPPVDPDAPNIFTAVQEQLGLKLEPGRGPVEVIVIDHLERPAFD
jgi:uncharacterized protein (TIGR03435 family)